MNINFTGGVNYIWEYEWVNLNKRPREKLNFRPPKEIFYNFLNRNHGSVAFILPNDNFFGTKFVTIFVALKK